MISLTCGKSVDNFYLFYLLFIIIIIIILRMHDVWMVFRAINTFSSGFREVFNSVVNLI